MVDKHKTLIRIPITLLKEIELVQQEDKYIITNRNQTIIKLLSEAINARNKNKLLKD
jgi:hypothetical protein